MVLIYGNARKELSAGYRCTTNNRMELTALTKALQALREPCQVEIISDSRYLLDALTQGWMAKWKRNGWRTVTKQPVRNRDLWEELDRLLARHETCHRWVKGHAATAENNRCDALAVAACRASALLVDEPYEAETASPSPD